MAEHSNDGMHLVPISTYTKVLLALLVLMVVTIALSFVDLTPWGNNVAAMTIATIKAGLVIAFFMGVRYGTNLTKIYAALGFIWFGFLFMAFCDYATRYWEPVKGWGREEPVAMPRHRMTADIPSGPPN